MKKIFLTMLMLVAATAIMSAQDEIEQTEAPVIYYENNDQGGFATITIYDEDPEAQIYWCYRFDYDGDFSEWMVYSYPVNFTEPGTYTVRAYAISPGKEASNMSELYFTVTENPVIVWGAYVYADGVDEENGLQVHICSDPSYGYDFMYGEMVLDGFKYQINHSGEWLQYDINASTIYLPEYGDYEIDAYGYADGHGSSATATAWIHYDADGYTSYSQPRDDYYQYYVHNDVAYYIMNDSTVCVSGREIPKTSPSFELPHPAKGDIVIPATFNWNEKTYTVTGIGNNAFNPSLLGESEMTSISIPNTVTSIGEGAFAYCSLLTSIVIPDAVTVINRDTFEGCYSLTNISIPDAVTSIGNDAFYGCSGLTKVLCKPKSTPAAGTNAFYDVYEQATLFVPNEALEAYRAHEEWGKFTHIVPFIGAGPGDANGDGSISVSDVTCIIDMLLSSDDLPAWADVNGDGTVSIIDVTTLIDMLLTGNY